MLVHSSNAILEYESLVSRLNMIPVPIEMRAFLYQVYGVEPHTMAYINEQNPNRIYIIVNGKLNYIDLPMINPKSSGAVEEHGYDLPGDSKTSLGSREFNKSWQMLTDGERERIQKECRKKKAYKTSLCRAFRETNKCENGEACGFAHGEKELRLPPKAHPKYKTQLCNKFSMWNYCPYGARCQFIHQRFFDQNMGFIDMMRTEDSNPYVDSLSVEQMNKSIKYMNSPVALGKHFGYPTENTDFCGAGNMGHSIETINNQGIENTVCGDQSRDNTGPVVNNTNLDQRSLVDNNNVLEWLNGRLNNMKMTDNSCVFPQSSFARSGSSGSK